MKKKSWMVVIIVALVIAILVLGIIFVSKRDITVLKCTKKTSDTSTEGLAIFTIKFKNDKMKLVESKSEIIAKSDSMKENIDVAYSAIQNQFSDYKNEKGVILKTSKAKNKISFTITVDATENPDLVEIVGSSITDKMTYEDAKKELESRSFSCK